MPARKKSSEKLMTIKPSGKKDENFFELLFEVARQIPKGRVTSYGAIAACLGAKSSARMVGWAMNGAGRVKPKVSGFSELPNVNFFQKIANSCIPLSFFILSYRNHLPSS